MPYLIKDMHTVEHMVSVLVDELRSEDGDPIIATAHLVAAISRETGTNRRHWTAAVDGYDPDYYPAVVLSYYNPGHPDNGTALFRVALLAADDWVVLGYIDDECVTHLYRHTPEQIAGWLAALKATVAG